MPEQPTDHKYLIKMLNQHLKANHNNTLELYKWFNTELSTDMYFTDFEMKCREQALHCDFPITLNNAIIMMTVVKTSNVELQNDIIQKNGELKSVRETVTEIANEGSQIMKSTEEEKSQVKSDPELKQVHTPGWFSMRNKGPSHTADQSQAQARPSCTKCGNDNKDSAE